MAINIQGQLEILGVNINGSKIDAALQKAFNSVPLVAELEKKLKDLGLSMEGVDQAAKTMAAGISAINTTDNLTKIGNSIKSLKSGFVDLNDVIDKALRGRKDEITDKIKFPSATEIKKALRDLAKETAGADASLTQYKDTLSNIRQEFFNKFRQGLQENVRALDTYSKKLEENKQFIEAHNKEKAKQNELDEQSAKVQGKRNALGDFVAQEDARSQIEQSNRKQLETETRIADSQSILKNRLLEIKRLEEAGVITLNEQQKSLVEQASILSQIEAKQLAINQLTATKKDQSFVGSNLDAINRDVGKLADTGIKKETKDRLENEKAVQKVIAAQEKLKFLIAETGENIKRGNLRVNEQEQAVLRTAQAFVGMRAEAVVAARKTGGQNVGAIVSEQDITNLTRTTNELKKTKLAAANAALTVENFGKSAALAFKRYSAFLFGSALILPIISNIRTAISEAIKLEQAFTKIEQVLNSDLSNGTLNLKDDIRELSATFGVAANDLAEGVFVFAQAGIKDLGDLDKIAQSLAKIPLSATFGDIQTTAEGLLAIFGQFNKTANDTADVLDTLNVFAADFAVESNDFFEAAKRGGAAFATAGGQFEDFVALFSVLRESTRESASSLGTFFKTGFAQLLQPSSQQQLRQLGVEADDVIGQLTELSAILLGPNSAFSEFERINIARELTGQRQFARLLALLRELQDTGVQNRIANAFEGAGGSLDNSLERRLDDVGTSINKVRESFNRLFSELLEDKALKAIVQQFSNIITRALSLTEVIKPLIAVLATLAISRGIKVLTSLGQTLGIAGIANFLSGGFKGGGANSVSGLTKRISFLNSLPQGVADASSSSQIRNLQKQRFNVISQRSLPFVLGGAALASSVLPENEFGNRANTVISGAAAGAVIGSVIPGVGTLTGALIGTAVTSIGLLIKEVNANTKELKKDNIQLAVRRGQAQIASQGFAFDQNFFDQTIGQLSDFKSLQARLLLAQSEGIDTDLATEDLSKELSKVFANQENFQSISIFLKGFDQEAGKQIRDRLNEQIKEGLVSNESGAIKNRFNELFIEALNDRLKIPVQRDILKDLLEKSITFIPENFNNIDLTSLVSFTTLLSNINTASQELSLQFNNLSQNLQKIDTAFAALNNPQGNIVLGSDRQILDGFGSEIQNINALIDSFSVSLTELLRTQQVSLINLTSETGATGLGQRQTKDDEDGVVSTIGNSVQSFLEKLVVSDDPTRSLSELTARFGQPLQLISEVGFKLDEFAAELLKPGFDINEFLQRAFGSMNEVLLEAAKNVSNTLQNEQAARLSNIQSIISSNSQILSFNQQIEALTLSIEEIRIANNRNLTEQERNNQRLAGAVSQTQNGPSQTDINQIVSSFLLANRELLGNTQQLEQVNTGGFDVLTDIPIFQEFIDAQVNFTIANASLDQAMSKVTQQAQLLQTALSLANVALDNYENGLISAGSSLQSFTGDALQESLNALNKFISGASGAGGLGTTPGTIGGIQSVSQTELQSVLQLLSSVGQLQLGPNLSGARLVDDINKEFGIQFASLVRSQFTGNAPQIEEQNIRSTLSALEQQQADLANAAAGAAEQERLLKSAQLIAIEAQRDAANAQKAAMENLSKATTDILKPALAAAKATLGSTSPGSPAGVIPAEITNSFISVGKQIETAVNTLTREGIKTDLQISPINVNVNFTATASVLTAIGSTIKEDITTAIFNKLSEIFEDEPEKASQLKQR